MEKIGKAQRQLEIILISDYDRKPKLHVRWRRHSPMPPYFWRQLKDLPHHLNLFQLFMRIRKVVYGLYGKKRDRAHSFADSRFTPLSQMLKRGMVSCGAITAIFGTTLRKFNIPVQFVHGKLPGQKADNRHAWLKIYDSKSDIWIIVDPGTDYFELRRGAKEIKTYFNWEELKKDYRKGEF